MSGEESSTTAANRVGRKPQRELRGRKRDEGGTLGCRIICCRVGELGRVQQKIEFERVRERRSVEEKRKMVGKKRRTPKNVVATLIRFLSIIGV